MGVGAHQVQGGRLRRGRGLAGEVAEHGDGGVHLDVPVALGGIVEPAVTAHACRGLAAERLPAQTRSSGSSARMPSRS